MRHHPFTADPRQYARNVARAQDLVLAGGRPGTAPRPVISQSWLRVSRQGVDPDRAAVDPVSPGDLEERRAGCGLTRKAVRTLRDGLVPLAGDTGHIVVIVDADGLVLWREGHPGVARRADRLGFVDGACWAENTVGTNAIGTALVERRPIQVHSTEHYARNHHEWSCAAAPIRDPRDGTLLGAVDISGPVSTAHPAILALVTALAGLAEASLREDHRCALDRLRATAAPLLPKVPGPALVLDRSGWVAAAKGLPPVDRVPLPRALDTDRLWLPALGHCAVELLPDGVLVRPVDDERPAVTRVVLDPRPGGRPSLVVEGETGSWTHRLSPRHRDILLELARHRAGLTAAELAARLFGDPSRTVTVRAELSRLRKRLPDLLDHRPYRFRDAVDVVIRD
ncbi:helix-turn-helix domain-containing protein [Amycolatopsis sp. ATCC 39116]|uniref:helix-turn-helix domain-containing protein n=1 Tax=Amycolatopsis sp. (strain ATCC 39116 / 75iv2) TaxID=385957 RepID=UPI0002626905|nr:helix-turn-helix domain-containing protein [Amycolatopsis sp. ATCC 39116]